MITVACLLWGNWCGERGVEYVVKLRSMIVRHLSVPHRFVCFTDYEMPSFIETLPMDIPNWRWNLRKMILYKPNNGLQGRVLALDLDMVITGSIDKFCDYNGRFCVLEDPWRPGFASGGMMSFEAGTLAEDLYYPLAKNPYKIGWELRGSEKLWYDRRLPNVDFWQNICPNSILDFKPSIKPLVLLTELPKNASLVYFHGKPRPHEVVHKIPWVEEHWN